VAHIPDLLIALDDINIMSFFRVSTFAKHADFVFN
jgi:hypothetical protein